MTSNPIIPFPTRRPSGTLSAGCDCWVIVPCYNEEQRFQSERFVQYAQRNPWLTFLFVDDGSRDATQEVLDGVVDRLPGQAARVSLAKNSGKAEAVRTGTNLALDTNAEFIGFWDADLATPLEDIQAFRSKLLDQEQLQAVIGSRLPLLGHRIERNPLRAWLGQMFARVASVTLGLGAVDTQCGAKLFRNNSATSIAFARPFHSNWIFDVEILSRVRLYLQRSDCADNSTDWNAAIYEQPLDAWYEIAGSKVRPKDLVKAVRELLTLVVNYRLRSWDSDSSTQETQCVEYSCYGPLLSEVSARRAA